MEISGAKIAEARTAISESQVTFATRIGVSVSTLQRWESGKDTPDANQLWTIAHATAKHVEWFYVDADAA